ncbi:carbohydrate hydrolase [candidate division MSBL1 archaeon SCGC-AAA259B11]|uniref:Carbohydrate hydrolase n=1 Tax=candidate division MSBL1 archaeon SCGC-AAA259B11 TaxID=1698260 RepID=A0A133U5S5_9EURY|nr:carbohydrate hydrolase [candidate division MSBL1 archaeon SCGC-AAA259B11]
MIEGYRRPNGGFGIRNYIAIIPSVICSSITASHIAEQIPHAIALTHHTGCSTAGDDLEKVKRSLVGLGKNPNVGGALVIGLGCEQVDPYEVTDAIKESGKIAKTLVIQEEGGIVPTIKKGVETARDISVKLSREEKVTGEAEELTLAIECGGSDTTSGIAANPAIGHASDLLIEKGGTTIVSETAELIGGEHILVKKADDKKTADKLIKIVTEVEKVYSTRRKGTGSLSQGNIEGGITTLEEKSLGCICKAGSASVKEVVRYGEKPSKKGLIIMDTPGFDVHSMTGMVAGGAQIIAFTTGRGSTVGFPIAPVIKITGNPRTYGKMKDEMDFNAGTIILGKKTIQEVGEEIFQKIIRVANGEKTKSEALGLEEFAISSLAGSK